jgi:hypothetical protein
MSSPNPESGLSRASNEHDALQRALLEIAHTERRLLAAGDVGALHRFGDVQAGLDLASALGYTLLAPREARVVDCLRYFPDGATLIRSYLTQMQVPRSFDHRLVRVTVETEDTHNDVLPKPSRQGQQTSRRPAEMGTPQP